MVVGFTTTCEISAYHGEVYSIQHYVIKVVSDLRQVDGSLMLLWFPPPTEILLKVALKAITLTATYHIRYDIPK